MDLPSKATARPAWRAILTGMRRKKWTQDLARCGNLKGRIWLRFSEMRTACIKLLDTGQGSRLIHKLSSWRVRCKGKNPRV
ncbi:hypothetical protein WJX84_010232 [Apatococcus fuscideae]|uniref:Uncharacterized protein n=1 Tax=Apatococcus fuscideae TaxID=2026836 RepID=A0AAW1T7G8_9CHLO